jgi:hypothetical protein
MLKQKPKTLTKNNNNEMRAGGCVFATCFNNVVVNQVLGRI